MTLSDRPSIDANRVGRAGAELNEQFRQVQNERGRQWMALLVLAVLLVGCIYWLSSHGFSTSKNTPKEARSPKLIPLLKDDVSSTLRVDASALESLEELKAKNAGAEKIEAARQTILSAYRSKVEAISQREIARARDEHVSYIELLHKDEVLVPETLDVLDDALKERISSARKLEDALVKNFEAEIDNRINATVSK